MKIPIAGGAGLAGSHLCSPKLERGHPAAALGTPLQWRKAQQKHRCCISADAFQPGSRRHELTTFDSVGNRAGKTRFKRRIEAYKQQGTNGRIQTTRNIVDDLPVESGCLGCVHCSPAVPRRIVDQPAEQEQTQQG